MIIVKKPKIRFKGFTETWEQRKLGDIVDRVTRKNTGLISNLPLTISAQYGLIDQNVYFDRRVASKDISGYYLINNGEFAYNKSTSVDAPWGAIKRLNRYENGVLSTLYIVFKIKNNNDVNSDFLVSYYDTNIWHKGISEIATEGARNHGLLNISPNDFFLTRLFIPCMIKEQEQIGSLFSKLDNLITLHQRKCENLKKLKKFMLQKTFPQNGENVPKIRFLGFTDTWEQRKLNDISEVRDGTHNSPKYQNTGHPFVTSKNIKDGFINYDDIQFISDEDFNEINKRSKVDVNDILMGMIGTIGNTALIRTEPDFAIKNVALIKDTKQINYLYLYHFLHSPFIGKQLSSGMDGGTQKFVSLGNVRNLDIVYPSEVEQIKLGEYFDHLDHLITLHQSKCDNLKEVKKYMLQNMFI